jgi:membrane fusion protein (multidrug efflux system)
VASTFSRSLRSLAADGFGRSSLGLFFCALLLCAWAAWFFFARVAVYEVTDNARVEVDRAALPIQSPIAGRIVASQLKLGASVQPGDLLLELDANAERLQINEERAQLAMLTDKINVIHAEIADERKGLGESKAALPVALEQARARYEEAQTAAHAAEEEARLLTKLAGQGLAPALDLLRAKAEADKRRAAAQALGLEVTRLEKEQLPKESAQLVRIERLNRDIAELQGEIAVHQASIERLKNEIEKHNIRAATAGVLGEIAQLQIGAVIQAGQKLGDIVPPGGLQVVAYYSPEILGRVRVGQPARLRLTGFPWTQYGAVAATVNKVANEARDGLLRVELAIKPAPSSSIPFQHGLPGHVEIEVDRASPAALALRAAGKRLNVLQRADAANE